MKKVVTIVGARPQFIKLAPLSRVLKGNYEQITIHTGQHYDYNMSKLFFDELKIPKPDYNLNISNGNHGSQTGMMMIELEKVLLKEKPNLVIVFGDTNSTIAGAIVATKLHIPVVHIEAGLRSFNNMMPEEINRIATDAISDYLFAPTETAMKHLANAGMSHKSFLTGDIMLDAVNYYSEVASEKSTVLKNNNISRDNYALLTLHRPYNVDNKETLCKIIKLLRQQENKIIFPVHPRTKKNLSLFDIKLPSNVITIDPVGYLDMLSLQKNSLAVITDSGGIQKEAFFLRKKCFTLRPETEWVETTYDKWNILIDPERLSGNEGGLDYEIPETQKEYFGKDVASNILSQIMKIV